MTYNNFLKALPNLPLYEPLNRRVKFFLASRPESR